MDLPATNWNSIGFGCIPVKWVKKTDYLFDIFITLVIILIKAQGSTLRKNFISPAGLVTETLTSPEIFLLALILMTALLK